jgi:hypothetical protein
MTAPLCMARDTLLSEGWLPACLMRDCRGCLPEATAVHAIDKPMIGAGQMARPDVACRAIRHGADSASRHRRAR